MRVRVPPQGDLTIQDIVNYLRNTGALNVKYDTDLDGVVEKADDANTVGGHAPGTAAGNVLVLNTAGQVPLANLPLLPASQLGFSFAWEKVAEIDVTASTASVSFTGLSGDTDRWYLLIGVVNNESTLARTFWIRFNADTIVTNYGFINWKNVGGTTSTTSQSFFSTTGTAAVPVSEAGASKCTMFCALINAEGVKAPDLNTYVIMIAHSMGIGTIQTNVIGGGWVKQAEVTEIDFIQVEGNYIGANSKLLLFKPKW